MTESTIDTILARIASNNGFSSTPFFNAVQSGRREAYEDVLTILGYYDDEREVLVR